MRKDGQAVLKTQNMQDEIAETRIGFLDSDEQDAAPAFIAERLSFDL
jgi:hypothetical protein